MLRTSSLLKAATAVATQSQWTRFLRILDHCGLGAAEFTKPASPHDFASSPFDAFCPLFSTNAFTFRDHQLTALGDVLIDEYLSEQLMDYCVHMGRVLSVNSVKQLNAVLHHHFALTLFAKDLHLDSLALPMQRVNLSDGAADETKETSAEDAADTEGLDFLEAFHPPPRKRDLNGTSFQIAPLRSGQSQLGWKFSHFVGALHQVHGPAGTTAVLEHLYALSGSGNLPAMASGLLVRVLQEYSAMNVAESLLAAQGLPLRFIGKTRHVSGPGGEKEEQQRPTHDPTEAENPHSAHSASPDVTVLVAGFSADRKDALDAVTLDALASSAEGLRAASLAAGPGVLDTQHIWWERTASLVQSRLEPDPHGALEDGWLTPAERRAYEGGPAFAHSVEFGQVTHTYADTYGVESPTDGKVVARRRFSKAVRDPLFYDKLSDMRNGVPFNTDGTPLAEFLDRFHSAHKRLFEVTMLAGNEGGRPVGRAIATRYSTARESACKAYIGGVLNDIRLIQEQPVQ